MQTVNQDGQGAKLPAHETFLVAAVLALVGGFLAIYTYLLGGGVFANAQTGNIVLLAANLAETNWSRAGYYLIPILAFSAGVFVTNLLKRCFSGTGGIRFEQVVLLIEAALLLGIGLLPLSVPDVFVNVTISFICSIQVNTFRKVRNVPYASTMCTGNLRSGTEKLYVYFAESFGKCGALFRDYRDVHRRSGLGRGSSQDLGSKKCLDLLSASGRDNSGDQRATKEINKEKQQNRPDERDFQKEDPRPSGLFFVCAMGAF